MSELSLNEIRERLGLLTDAELEQVIQTASALRGKKVVLEAVQPWYAALGRVLHELVLWEVPPLVVLPVATQQRVEKSHREVVMWLQRVFQPPLTQVEQFWALDWCARLLAEHLQREDRPLCLNGLLYATHDIPGIVDQAFPGYLRMGILRKVLQKFASQSVRED